MSPVEWLWIVVLVALNTTILAGWIGWLLGFSDACRIYEESRKKSDQRDADSQAW